MQERCLKSLAIDFSVKPLIVFLNSLRECLPDDRHRLELVLKLKTLPSDLWDKKVKVLSALWNPKIICEEFELCLGQLKLENHQGPPLPKLPPKKFQL